MCFVDTKLRTSQNAHHCKFPFSRSPRYYYNNYVWAREVRRIFPKLLTRIRNSTFLALVFLFKKLRRIPVVKFKFGFPPRLKVAQIKRWIYVANEKFSNVYVNKFSKITQETMTTLKQYWRWILLVNLKSKLQR